MNVRAHKSDHPKSEEVNRDMKRIIKIWEDCRKKFSGQGDFLFGKFCALDAMFAPVIFRFNTYGVELPDIAKNKSEKRKFERYNDTQQM